MVVEGPVLSGNLANALFANCISQNQLDVVLVIVFVQ